VPFTVLTGFGRHPLKAMDPQRYSMAVNGPWRITFEFRDGDGYLVDSEQYQ
jgi:proteic killer suppression protein